MTRQESIDDDHTRVFPCGGPVGGEHLVGRETEIARITKMLSRGQSVVLAGPRRYGKTSVLLEVLGRLRDKGLHTTFVDLFEVANVGGLADRLVGGALRNEGMSGPKLVALARQGVQRLKERIKIAQLSANGMEVLLEFSGDPDPHRLLASALDLPDSFAARYGVRAVVALDEAGELLTLDGEGLLKLMRARCQQHENTAYLFSGSQETLLTRLFTHKAQAFYGFARIETLGPVETKAWQPYITGTFADHGRECPTKVVRAILKITGGHPYYTQHLCQSIFYTRGSGEPGRAVKLAEVDWALELTLDHHRAYFDELWGSLRRASYLQRGLTRSLALEPDISPYTVFKGRASNAAVYRSLMTLIEKGVLARVTREAETG